MKSIQNLSRLAMLVFVILICVTGCKSKKKALEASNAAAEKAKMEQEQALRKQKEEELRLAEQNRKEEEQAQRSAEEKRRLETNAPRMKLSQYFNTIAGAGNSASANSSINEALSLFTSTEVPVLIVISESGGQKDYDRPTTIKDYLYYLKDQKKNINKIADLKFDSSGKITELELIKN